MLSFWRLWRGNTSGKVPDFPAWGGDGFFRVSPDVPVDAAWENGYIMSDSRTPQAYQAEPPTPAGRATYPFPKAVRASSNDDGRVVAGVCAGLSDHLGVPVLWVRLAFLVAIFSGGVGMLAYIALWALLPTGSVRVQEGVGSAKNPGKATNRVLVVLAVIAAAVTLSFITDFAGPLLLFLVPLALGVVLVWRAYDRGLRSWSGILSVLLGVVLSLGGVVIVLFSVVRGEDEDVTSSLFIALLAVTITLLGVGVLAGPGVMRLWNHMADSRVETAAATQRAEIASHLHDSVLQTLALIQKQADNPAQVERLARSQERELRQWLFAPESTREESAFGELQRVCAAVEDRFGVSANPVTVGEDPQLTGGVQATIDAASEAITNAAKHAGVTTVDVYAEHLGGTFEVFIRDRGIGFDPAAVGEDRHGISDSITGRMERAGGSARVRSTLGQGTEIHVSVPVE
ncbi:two component sensor kinase [Corynebacterium renale]|nr:two component sensor kinase [Corynebacterium renale]STC94334.1 two component sensor kinase [Corynebacterium renale]